MTRRGINVARHKASPEHPSRSRRWRHWQWKVELWLKIERLRKNSFKSTGGGKRWGRWRREVRPMREEGVAKGGTYRCEILPPWHPTAIWHFRRDGRIPAKPLSLSPQALLVLSLSRLHSVFFCTQCSVLNPGIAILMQYAHIYWSNTINKMYESGGINKWNPFF